MVTFTIPGLILVLFVAFIIGGALTAWAIFTFSN
jgi:hypothetical protein